MKIPCRQHPNSNIERICASSTCRRDPCLCWECMIDEADHARSHRDVMIDLSSFAGRLDQEFKNLVEKRKKDKSQATEGHLKLLEDQYTYKDDFKKVTEKNYQLKVIQIRKKWGLQIVEQAQEQLNTFCENLKAEIDKEYEERFIQYEESLNFIVNSIQHKYGLAPLPTKEEIIDQLEEHANNNKQCNDYIIELKQKLLPPEDLNKNLAFIDTYKDFEYQNEVANDVQQETDQLQEENGENYYEKEPVFQEIIKITENQCRIFFDELKSSIIIRDPFLSRHSKADLHESLNTLPNEQQSGRKDEYQPSPQKLSPFATSLNFDVQQTLNPKIANKQEQQIQFQSIETGQQRGITSILQIDQRQIASGSRDKTVRINNLDQPAQGFTLDGHIDQVTALCLFQEKLLVSGGGNLDSSIIVWSLAHRKMLHRLCGHQSGITSIIELSDRNCILSGSYDNLAIIWNANIGKSVCALKKHTAMVSSLLLLKKDIIITGSWDRTMAIWQLSFENDEISSAQYLREIHAEGAVLCMKKISERNLIYGGTSNKVCIIDWHTGDVKSKFNTSQFGICDLLVGDQLIGLGASDSTIRIWKQNEESEVFRDTRIQINNYNTNPKMIQINKKTIAVVNNGDQNPHFNLVKFE